MRVYCTEIADPGDSLCGIIETAMGRLVFLPGFACRSWIWERVVPALEVRWACELLDWPLDETKGFADLEGFADWIIRSHGPALASADAVVGHSMGGLLALMLCAGGRAARAVLVDTQLTPPDPFFRSLLAPGTDEPTRRAVGRMARECSPHFHPSLRGRLKAGDFAGLAKAGPAASAVYGMRGCAEPRLVREHLGWPGWLERRVACRFVPASAHFPMLENPPGFLAALTALLDPGQGRGRP